jgi:sulfoxide reductase heme-binding subunit YedZ
MSAFAGLPLAWIVARAAGLLALALLTLSVWLGLAMSTKLLGARRQKSLLAWHRSLTWAGLSMVGLHLVAVLLDPVLHFGLAAALVPFAAPWKPIAVGAGVVAGWLSLALAASFKARRWIGQKGWRRLHYASFAAFALALGHALYTGTDLQGVGGPAVAAIAAGPVVWLGLARILLPRARRASVPAGDGPAARAHALPEAPPGGTGSSRRRASRPALPSPAAG